MMKLLVLALLCLLPLAVLANRPSDAIIDASNIDSIFNDFNAHAEHPSLFEKAAAKLIESEEKIEGLVGEIVDFLQAHNVTDLFQLEDNPIPVPYKNCGKPDDLITITNITSTVWPPVQGSEAILNINFVANEVITGGQYTAVVSVNGWPLVNKNGDISKYFKLPIQKGPVSIQKDIKIPSGIPISGAIGLQLSAVNNNGNELFCLQVSFNI